tara:strand:- start:252 stop:458 length:207 start_codon:yes stop_codon:yes gene_type:complete
MKLREAINNMCRYCIYDPYSEGTWRKQVEECTGYECPLYKARPMRINQNSDKNLTNMAKKETNIGGLL